MLYLDKVTIHNFKSFRQATISFSKGLNCIVGPNGSGKSNICDSLLFGFGESSLKRLRASSSLSLINASAKPSSEDIRKAYVSISLAGDSPVEIVRSINSKNKLSYRMNGKHVSKQELMDVLHAQRCVVDSTNTITQGEVARLLSLSPKERRQLIDIAAGISEFDEKKDASLKELEKVEARMTESNIMLGERAGFLNELEKEKRDAERYIELTGTVKRMNYTILKLREAELSAEFEKSARNNSENAKRRDDKEKHASELNAEIEKISSEKEQITKRLTDKSMEINNTSRAIEEINKEMAVGSEQLNSIVAGTDAARTKVDSLSDEQKSLTEKCSINSEAITKLKADIESKAKSLSESESRSPSAGNTALVSKYEENKARMDDLSKKIDGLSSSRMQASMDLSNLKLRAEEITKEIQQLSDEKAKGERLIQDERKAADSLKAQSNEKRGKALELQKRIDALEADIGRIDSDNITTREAIVLSGSASSSEMDALKRHVKSGIHGRVGDLCTYDDKYAIAVQAAAQSRLNYIVVDSIGVADEAIKVLKDKKLGRASFIPIEDVVVREGNAKDAERKGLKPLISFVEFDAKFRRAMEYVFSNTYLVPNIAEAKKIGVGALRFVTLEGEIVDPSGIVTGGTMRQVQQRPVLEAKLRKLNEQKAALSGQVTELRDAIEALHKEIAKSEFEAMARDTRIENAVSGNSILATRMGNLDQKRGETERMLKERDKEAARIGEQTKSFENELEALKSEGSRLYSEISSLVTSGSSVKVNKEEAARMNSLRKEVEQFKMELASTSKENAMHSQRLEVIAAEIKAEQDKIGKFNSSRSEINKRIKAMEANKAELQQKIKGHDSDSASLYKGVQEMEASISRMSFEKGKITSEMEKAGREMQEAEMIKMQLQTRLSDIKAELMNYTGVEQVEGAKMKELEERLVLVKGEIATLGNVNLKAPEIYDEKKRDVEEARHKLAVLESEKASILLMIEEVESKKLNVFKETLTAVNEHFHKLFNYTFEGSASLQLDNPKDPFNSGLKIQIEHPKRKSQTSDTLSGGEKSLVLIMLIFAIQMRNPMSFYIFDEIDAALDAENSKKLSKLAKELSRTSQFIVVSHNNASIQAADTAIGVIKKDGESHVVGIQLADEAIRNQQAQAVTQ